MYKYQGVIDLENKRKKNKKYKLEIKKELVCYTFGNKIAL